ncbi:PalH/RIM21-domain-containing protein, partial [Pseudomassariella vexata]
CDAIILPANGVLSFASGAILTLAADTVFKPACSSVVAEPAIIANGGVNIDQTTSSSDPQFSDFRDPFYASTFPQCYALAATTIISYMLVIMLLIAPRSFLDGGVVVLGRRGFTNGHSNGISIGGRPWLQKVAALTVAISLTIATADTFRVAEDQYAWGIQNAEALQDEVLGGTQLKVIRLISDTFLWLAQAQTLIRLFPRQREKVIIKWTAFSLITLDVIFGALNSFQYSGPGNTRPRSFTDAVPALSYLFQLSLGLLYAAWVLYYSLMKKRYAFYHPLMKNICLVACLSVISILVPVVFFILDISKPEFTGWGDYVRWVGAAAASVVVWEWVERIEALEREEKKDGILGREVFDGDEMMEASSTDFSWPRRRKTKKKGEDEDGGESGGRPSDRGPPSRGRSKIWPAMSSITSRYMSRSVSHSNSHQKSTIPATTAGRSPSRFLQPPLWPSRPPPAVTPISRADTASADSTVYAVRYAPLTETASRTTDDRAEQPLSRSNSSASSEPDGRPSNSSLARAPSPDRSPTTEPEADHRAWRAVYKFASFRSSAHAPPAEVLPHAQKLQPSHRDFEGGRWDIRSRFEDFAAIQAERMREKMRPTPDTESLPVTVIPAPPRRGAALAQLLEEE